MKVAALDLGSVRLTEMFVSAHPIPPDEIAKMTAYIQDRIREARSKVLVDTEMELIAVGGTPTTLAALDQGQPFEADRVDGYVLPIGRLRHWVQRLASLSIEERQQLSGLEPKRADVIAAGSLVLMIANQSFNAKELRVSVKGLRYGLARSLGRST